MRRRFGLYETPLPLVGYIVRAVHELLQGRFGRPAGLADPAVRLLDPAAGAMSFLLAAWRLAVEEDGRSGERGQADAAHLLRRHLLPHSLGLEVLPSACGEGTAAVRRFLAPFGPELADAPVPLRLGDALSGPPVEGSVFEALPGGDIVPVVLGNPPWRGHSEARGTWIRELLRGYRLPDGRVDEGWFRVDGRPLGERNAKWLHDDCLRFLRLAQWEVDRAGQGIVALVLNHNLLDAPTCRGVRRSLLATFDEVFAYDLHGNWRKREAAPGGAREENVFPEVRQGAAVLLLVKRPGLARRVLRADLHGRRREKLSALSRQGLVTTPWAEVEPRAPSYLFLPEDRRVEREYQRGLPLGEIFPIHGPGLITGDDALLTAGDRHALEARLAPREGDPTSALLPADRLTTYLARPFDERHLLYVEERLARPRPRLLRHLLGGGNLALLAPRLGKEEPGAFVTAGPAGHKAVSAYDVCSLFPLYLAPPQATPLAHAADGLEAAGAGPVPNLNPGLCRRLGDLYGEAPGPEAVLGYVYAVLYAPSYRARYRDLLARGFPRIPFPRDGRRFVRLAQLGGELIALHLLRDARLRAPGVRFLDGGSARSERLSARGPVYVESDGRLYLWPGGPCFEGIEPDAWRYRIGGYRVLPRWLAGRRLAGRARGLSWQDNRTLRRIAAALAQTVPLQRRIDEAHQESEADVAALRSA